MLLQQNANIIQGAMKSSENMAKFRHMTTTVTNQDRIHIEI